MLIHRCTVERNTRANVGGEATSSYASIATGVHCLVQESHGRHARGAAGEYLSYDAIGFFKLTQDIQPQVDGQEQDRITLTGPSRLAGRKYLVIHAGDEAGMPGGYLTALLRHVPATT